MSNKNLYFKLGVFVIVAVILLTITIVAIGADSFSKKGQVVETYFDSSVQGIDVGAKVKYRGVQVGSVIDIDFVGNRYGVKSDQSTYVVVLIGLTKNPFHSEGGDFEKLLDIQAQRGLRAQLQAQGITGSSYVELDYLNPVRYPAMEISWKPKDLYIPSAPSIFVDIISSIESMADNLQNVDFATLSKDLTKLINTAQAKLDAMDTKKINDDFLALLDSLNQTSLELNKLIKHPRNAAMLDNFAISANKLRVLLDNPALGSSLQKIDQTLGQLNIILGGKNSDIEFILTNLRDTTDNLNHLIEDLSANPSRIINGPPPPKLIE